MGIAKISLRRSLALPLLTSGLLVVGCTPSHHASAPIAATSQPAPPRQSVRIATAADLKLYIHTWRAGPDGFPQLVLDLRSRVNDDLLVAYAQGSVVVHCGPYVQRGPLLTGLRRREVLDPYGSLNFFSPRGGWIEIAEDGTPQLVIPVKLPTGKYPLWATFEVAGEKPALIETERQTYRPD